MKICLLFFLLLGALCSFSEYHDFLPKPSPELVHHTYYIISYNEKFEQANWVYYELTDSMVIEGGQERSNKFKVDPEVPTGSAKSSDYTKSGYDRGHLCPAADMDFDPVAMEESFYMSNISPQAPEFNRGIWKDLETEVRKWAQKKHRLYVVTGPVFNDNQGTIGRDQVLVPGYFFKILFDSDNKHPEMIAFVLPNRKSDRPITDFAVSVDEVEKLTGFDFFSQLPDDEENVLESHVNLSGWFDGYETTDRIDSTSASRQNSENEDNTYFYVMILVILLLVIAIVILRKSRKR